MSEVKSIDKKLSKEIEDYLSWLFIHHVSRRHESYKLIHDNIWGTERFSPSEMALIDSPLLQRLRKIGQTGLSVYTYPSTTHTRFSHSLGVYSQVKKLIQAVNQIESSNNEMKISDTVQNSLKFSALLHDVGHGPFSHLSEEIYGSFPEIENEKNAINLPVKAHELLSYSIAKSDYLKNYLYQIQTDYNIEIDSDLIPNAIIGKPKDQLHTYEVEFINGAFDADKLDYLMRDGVNSGLPLNIDLDRLWYAVRIYNGQFFDSVAKAKINGKKLVIKRSSASVLEQIVFAKMILFMNFYQHQKIRSTECMYKAIIEYIQDNNIEFDLCGDKKIDFKRATDFLYVDDNFFLNNNITILRKNDIGFHRLVHNMQYRRHFVRAMVISYDSIGDKQKSEKEASQKDAWDCLLNERKKEKRILFSDENLRKIAKEIFIIVSKNHPKILKEEIWIDLPSSPKFKEAEDTYLSPINDEEPLLFSDFFPANKWADQYVCHKYKGHIFCPPEYVESVALAAKLVLERNYGFEFNSLAFDLCKVKEPSIGDE